ncbi:hypothetical protein NQ318_015583 [Aromia moschata]|uniref:CUB domain-containing protein n=1 Tax=Aromia moschata TaxID=1265417 RepID=A0AAV8XBQ4_9CUCU|nr:hypothetical protein NQ318_015583 [Aromia moschata]
MDLLKVVAVFFALNETKIIQSPNLKDLDCHWTIIADTDYQIQIHFTELNIPASCTKMTNATFTFCTCSFIEIRDGASANSDLIMRLCSRENSATNRNFTTSSNVAFIRFFLMGVKNNVFKATLTPVLSKCGPTNYNDLLDKHVFCGKGDHPFDYYSIRGSLTVLFDSSNSIADKGKGFKLEYSIAVFDVQGNCADNYIKVITYSNNLEDSHTFCKDDNPGVLRSNSRIKVEYSSSAQNGGTGWIALFQGVAVDAPNPI